VKLETLWKEYEYRRLTLRPPSPPAARSVASAAVANVKVYAGITVNGA